MIEEQKIIKTEQFEITDLNFENPTPASGTRGREGGSKNKILTQILLQGRFGMEDYAKETKREAFQKLRRKIKKELGTHAI